MLPIVPADKSTDNDMSVGDITYYMEVNDNPISEIYSHTENQYMQIACKSACDFFVCVCR